MMSISNISLASFNVNGLNIQSKRRAIFRKVKQLKYDIVCLQETHSTFKSAKFWEHEWGGGQCFFAHGASNSKGVAIMVSRSFSGECELLEIDKNGRYIIVKVTTDVNDFTLCSVYAPTRDRPTDQSSFFTEFEKALSNLEIENILIGGDLNVYLDKDLDATNISREAENEGLESQYYSSLVEFMEEASLCDIWRIRNPKSRSYTFLRGNSQSRIDYWLISEHLSEFVDKTAIKAGVHSDHNIVSISFKNKNNARGPGIWKFNNLMLQDESFIEAMEEFIVKFHGEEIPRDPQLKWDFMKFRMREFSIKFAKDKAKEKRKFVSDLDIRLRTLQSLFNRGTINENLQQEYNTTVRFIKEIETEKALGCIFRSKANWSQHGERCSKYFLGLEKRRFKRKSIQALVTESGEVISGNEEVLEEERLFYEKLYTGSVPNSLPINTKTLCLRDANIPKLSEKQSDSLDRPLSGAELLLALRNMKKGKSPGSDGLTVEFYQAFWGGLSPVFMDSVIAAFDQSILSLEQRRSIITLIPKKDKDRRYLKNWRPISLLNVDYKIISKAMATRLQAVLGSIIHQDQKGFMRGRNIGDGLREIEDLISFSSIKDIPGLIVALDIEKAFDSLRWDMLDAALEIFGFGTNFRKWTQIFFSEIQTCVSNNGHSSGYFSPSRGVRQGCNISPFFFIIALEILAIRIRHNRGIIGLSIGNASCKIGMFADDMTCFVKDPHSVSSLMAELITFSRISGLKMNPTKSSIMPIGNFQTNSKELAGIPVVRQCKLLGIWYFSEPNTYMHYSLNYKHIIETMRSIITNWKHRDLTIKGKITLYNSLLISRLMYVSNYSHVPGRVYTEINHMVAKFVYGNKMKVAYEVLIQPIQQGGLKLADYEKRVQAQRLGLFQRILNGHMPLSKAFIEITTGCKAELIFQCRTEWSSVVDRKSLFWKDAFRIWSKIRRKTPLNAQETAHETLWFNPKIKIKGKKLYNEEWYEAGIVHVKDIVRNNTFKSHETIREQFNVRCSFIDMLRIRQALPREWKDIILELDNKILDIESTHLYNLDSKTTMDSPFTILRAKSLYQTLLENVLRAPTGRLRWEEYCIDNGLAQPNWVEFYERPFKIFRETKFQSFYHRMVHRYIPCNAYRAQIRAIDSSGCNFCTGRDDIPHFLLTCDSIQLFRSRLYKWIFSMFKIDINQWSSFEQIFGKEEVMGRRFYVVNALLIYSHFYVYRQKLHHDCNLDFIQWSAELRARLKIERHICYLEKKEKKFKKWEKVYRTLT